MATASPFPGPTGASEPTSRHEPATLLARLLSPPGRAGRMTHLESIPARHGRRVSWPPWVPPELVRALEHGGIPGPWEHQAVTAEHARAGRSVVIATGTASGKSLAFLLPSLAAVMEGSGGPRGRGATVLYLAPTKALAHDQLRGLHDLALPGLWAAAYDGDTPAEERDRIREHATYVLTNPDMVHRSLLPSHRRWAAFLRSLRYVVVDEAHEYRGVFGSHVAQVLRRLRRVCAHHGADPVFLLASATVSEPRASAERLVGAPVIEVTDDASPRGQTSFALWEPPLTSAKGEHGAPVRRTATAEAADLLADLVAGGVRTLVFVRSRRGAETAATLARRRLEEIAPGITDRVAAYRAGYLPGERRAVEQALDSGDLLGVASTTALELGVDVSGLDVVVLAGYPGTRSSMWQQAGRAGREGRGSLAVLVARGDPLDTYLVHHPEALFGQPVESTVLDPDNPYVLAPHLCAAAAEQPVTEKDLGLFGPAARDALDRLTAQGLLRRRTHGWFWTGRGRAADLADIRGSGGPPVCVVEEATGRLLGTCDAETAPATVHDGAVYVHQGQVFLVNRLDLDERVALVEPADPDYTTSARDVTDIRVLETVLEQRWGRGSLAFGTVQVTTQVVSYLRTQIATARPLGEEPLDLPPRTLRTRAVWWTVSTEQVDDSGVAPAALPGAAHAAEHAAIGLLPLFATCDRWDIGGVSTGWHVDTGQATVFVYDGHPGGAGFAERAYHAAGRWLRTTREAIASCECTDGCPSCVQSPKCGNANSPLDKAGAVRLLDTLLMESPADDQSA